eukprot:gene5731-biopygen4850
MEWRTLWKAAESRLREASGRSKGPPMPLSMDLDSAFWAGRRRLSESSCGKKLDSFRPAGAGNGITSSKLAEQERHSSPAVDRESSILARGRLPRSWAALLSKESRLSP